MKFYDPQVSLYKHVYIDGADKYFLHTIVFTDNSALEAAGANVDMSKAKTEATISVELIIKENKGKPAIECVNPVSHTIALGDLENDDLTFIITQDIQTSSSTEKSRPKPRAATPRAVIISRPIGDDSVEAAWKESFGHPLCV